ncbi:MAG: bifunctional glutamate N-acetyltransferase/amino-acid acetyltransferase ArgJ [Solirubrobacteraceae bacterium]|nr:MAG: bifunctional glutamate N-acetyltransferase/amino-acid acetyltransferase ArgJ [Solirubrobacterales bacterium]
MSFFASRWVESPGHVRELAPTTLPEGFRAAGTVCGIKPSGGLDVGLLVSDTPGSASAARFTRSGVQAAPVLVCRERCRLDAMRVVAVNSGNANAATGRAGLDAALRMQDAAAAAAGVDAELVAVASTGVIGVALDGAVVSRGLTSAATALRADGGGEFAEAIRTTDAFSKLAALEVELPGGRVRLCAQAKGAGMIQPGLATLLCFVETDAVLEASTADLLLGVTCARSFERISVDGQLSTNDTVLLLASGASGVTVEPESDGELRLGEALDALLRQLALLVVKDGEGATRVGRIEIRGGHLEAVERVARAVANSPLVKAALHGGDPNWGRIAQAVGMALPGTAPLQFDIEIGGIAVCREGTAVSYDAGALAAAVAGEEVDYLVELPGAGVAESECFFSDLSHDYVTINSEYTT